MKEGGFGWTQLERGYFPHPPICGLPDLGRRSTCTEKDLPEVQSSPFLADSLSSAEERLAKDGQRLHTAKAHHDPTHLDLART